MSSTEFYYEWMENSRWWFHSTPHDDEYITDKYEHLLDENLTFTPLSTQLIVLDQLPRHVYRREPSNHILAYFLRRAMYLLHTTPQKQKYFDSLSLEEWIFHMLPLRHTKDVNLIHYVMQEGWKRLFKDKDNKLLKRFLKATYQRCPLEGSQHMFWKVHVSKFVDMNMQGILNHPISKRVYQNLLPYKHEKVILSLSGGVDSMVLSVILKALKEPLDLDIVAVMINYGNRYEADDEEDFVVDWCKNKIGCPVVTRKIHEIKRETCRIYELRELYESYTRNVRYACYKDVYNTWWGEGQPKVLMGHNKDDCFENILTNIVQGKKYENLTGMTCSSMTDGIEFIRPMLNINKKQIYQFAEDYHVLHLPDSTVSWCQRGMIRDKVKPILTQWDERCVPAFFEASQVMTELYEVVKIQVSLYKKRYESGTLQLDPNEILPKSKLFWRMFLFEITGIHISNKSVVNLIDRLTLSGALPKYSIEVHKNISLHVDQILNRVNILLRASG